MKRVKKNSVVIALAAATIPLLMGCGKGSGSSGIGYIPGSVMGPGSCVPINLQNPNQQIPFTGSNVQFSPISLRAGAIPRTAMNEPYAGQSFGSTVIGGALTGGPYQRSGVDGTISMNIQQAGQYTQPGYGYPQQPGYPQPYPTYPTYPGTGTQGVSAATINGFVTISAAKMQEIAYYYGGGMGTYPTYPTYPTTPTYPSYPSYPGAPVPTMPTSTMCVSGIAMNLGVYNNTFHSGNVYLYLNNSQNGVSLYF